MKKWPALVAFGIVGCSASAEEPAVELYPLSLPAGLPAPIVPKENPVTPAKVELGRHLFYDKRLSANGSQSCASCHDQARAFSDGRARPLGSTGQELPRNAPGLQNVAYFSTLTWQNPVLDTLEKHAQVPLFAENPIELEWNDRTTPVILARLRAEPRYQKLFADAFPGGEVSIRTIVQAITSFERAMVSADSPYDRFAYRGQRDALSDAAKRGFDLFNSEQAECYHCHTGPNFAGSFVSVKSGSREALFENTGLYDIDGQGSYPAISPGLVEFTQKATDRGRYRVPSLRNVALTAPYMHDGSVATLEEVLDLYAAGGRHVTEGSNAGDGRKNPNKSSFVRPFTLSEQEKRDLIAFLESLTDQSFVTDPRFADPW